MTPSAEDRPAVVPDPNERAGAEPIEPTAAEPDVHGHRAAEPAVREAPVAEPARTRGERLLESILPGAESAGAIYGMIAIGALLAAESGLRETYLETLSSALLTLALYWLAHAYADLLGQRLQTRERLTAGALGRNLLHDLPIMRGGAVPLLVLVVCWAVGVDQESAVTVDLWATAGNLVAYELLAGLRARARPAELLLEGCVGAAMGLGVLALRVILH